MFLTPRGKYSQQPYKSPWPLALSKHTTDSKMNLLVSYPDILAISVMSAQPTEGLEGWKEKLPQNFSGFFFSPENIFFSDIWYFFALTTWYLRWAKRKSRSKGFRTQHSRGSWARKAHAALQAWLLIYEMGIVPPSSWGGLISFLPVSDFLGLFFIIGHGS